MNKRLIFKNLSEDDRMALVGGTLTISGFLAAGGIYHFMNMEASVEASEEITTEDSDDLDLLEDLNVEEDFLVVDTEFDVFESSDSLSFNEAFAQARALQGPGGFFEWNGNSYNTFYKEELEAKSTSEKHEYYQGIEDAVHTETFNHVNINDLSSTSNYIPAEEDSVLGDLDQNSDGLIDDAAISIAGSGVEVSLDEALDIVEAENPSNINEPSEMMGIGSHQVVMETDDNGESSVSGIMNTLDHNDDGIIDFGATDIAITESMDSDEGVSGIMKSLDQDDDGIIDFGATDMDLGIVSNDGIQGTMQNLDQNDDGIIDFGASDIDGGFASVEDVNSDVVSMQGNMDSLDNDDDGIIDFGASDINSGSLADTDDDSGNM